MLSGYGHCSKDPPFPCGSSTTSFGRVIRLIRADKRRFIGINKSKSALVVMVTRQRGIVEPSSRDLTSNAPLKVAIFHRVDSYAALITNPRPRSLAERHRRHVALALPHWRSIAGNSQFWPSQSVRNIPSMKFFSVSAVRELLTSKLLDEIDIVLPSLHRV